VRKKSKSKRNFFLHFFFWKRWYIWKGLGLIKNKGKSGNIKCGSVWVSVWVHEVKASKMEIMGELGCKIKSYTIQEVLEQQSRFTHDCLQTYS